MRKIQIEFTDNTWVSTDHGVARLRDLLDRAVKPCLWSISWKINGVKAISFHPSFGAARDYADSQLGVVREGRAQLVNVSSKIFDIVESEGVFICYDMVELAEAETYGDRAVRLKEVSMAKSGI